MWFLGIGFIILLLEATVTILTPQKKGILRRSPVRKYHGTSSHGGSPSPWWFQSKPVWWFGTFGLFLHSVGNVIIPTDERHHFSEALKLVSIIYGITLPIDELIFFKMVMAPPTRILRHAHTWEYPYEYPISSCTWLYPLDLLKILVCFALRNAPIRESIARFDSYPDIPLMAKIGIWPKYFKMFTHKMVPPKL